MTWSTLRRPWKSPKAPGDACRRSPDREVLTSLRAQGLGPSGLGSSRAEERRLWGRGMHESLKDQSLGWPGVCVVCFDWRLFSL